MFLIGIDGGGTSTRVELRDEQNQLLSRKFYGALNLNSIGEAAFYDRLKDIFSLPMQDCFSICIGAAGVSNQDVERILREILAEVRYEGPWKLCGDQEIALRGAMDGPGIAVIAGTGSICFGKNEKGETARSGGYGHLIDDWGSGYALGRDALSAAVKTIDGRENNQALCSSVFQKLRVTTAQELISFVYSGETKKSDVAALAAVVLELAEKEDQASEVILRKEAEEVVCMVKAVQKNLSLEGCSIALLGGLFASDNPYRKIVSSLLGSMGKVQLPRHDALWGAAQMAWELRKNNTAETPCGEV